MKKAAIDRRVLALALLATLAIRILAWAPWGGVEVLAGDMDPTIPTPTPSVAPGELPTRRPPEATSTAAEEAPTQTAAVQTPGTTPSPSQARATEPAQPANETSTVAAQTSAQPEAAPLSATIASPATAATLVDALPLADTSPTSEPAIAGSVPALDLPTPTHAVTSDLTSGAGLSVTCLWGLAGVALIGAGLAVLGWLRRR